MISSWNVKEGARYDEKATEARAAGCFDLANRFAERADLHRADRSPVRYAPNSELPLHERIFVSRDDCVEWDRLRDEGVALDHLRPFGPRRSASSNCQSGRHDYCTCDTCF